MTRQHTKQEIISPKKTRNPQNSRNPSTAFFGP